MLAHMNMKRMAGGLLIPLLLFLIIGAGKVIVDDPPAGGDPTTTTVPTACANSVHYYRHDLPAEVNHFGPAAPDNDVNAALSELHTRRCADPALTVAHRQYSARQYTSPEERLAQTEGLASDPQAWALNVLAIEGHEKAATSVEIVDMTERYNTLYMIDTPTPAIFQDVVDRPQYRVLRFTYADGSVDNYKLDCGFQPVEPVFPGVPAPPAPAPQQGGKVTPSGPTPTVAPKPGPTPTTCDPRVCKGPDREPAPCRTSDGVDCGGPGAGGQPGTGGASNHGSDGYSPQDPAPPPIVTTVKPPPSTTMLPPTSLPPTTVLPKPIG